MELRPLSFGEIFDRAVTLYVRNFVPIAAIVAVTIVPLSILQYVVDRAEAPYFAQIIAQAEHPVPAADPFASLAPLFGSPLTIAATLLLLVIGLLVWPFTLNAVAIGVARLYRGRPIEFASCYRAAIAPWLPVVGLIVVEFAILCAWYFSLVFSAIIFGVVAVGLGGVALAVGIVVGIIGGAVVLAEIALLGPLVIALAFAMYAIIIERENLGAALQSGFTRVFSRAEFWRAVLFALALGAIAIAAIVVAAVVASLMLLLHAVALEVIVSALVRVAIAPFSVVLLAVYYFDVRIRREGFDLETALDRLADVPASG